MMYDGRDSKFWDFDGNKIRQGICDLSLRFSASRLQALLPFWWYFSHIACRRWYLSIDRRLWKDYWYQADAVSPRLNDQSCDGNLIVKPRSCQTCHFVNDVCRQSCRLFTHVKGMGGTGLYHALSVSYVWLTYHKSLLPWFLITSSICGIIFLSSIGSSINLYIVYWMKQNKNGFLVVLLKSYFLKLKVWK